MTIELLRDLIESHGFKARISDDAKSIAFDVPWYNSGSQESGYITEHVRNLREAREALGY